MSLALITSVHYMIPINYFKPKGLFLINQKGAIYFILPSGLGIVVLFVRIVIKTIIEALKIIIFLSR